MIQVTIQQFYLIKRSKLIVNLVVILKQKIDVFYDISYCVSRVAKIDVTTQTQKVTFLAMTYVYGYKWEDGFKRMDDNI